MGLDIDDMIYQDCWLTSDARERERTVDKAGQGAYTESIRKKERENSWN